MGLGESECAGASGRLRKKEGREFVCVDVVVATMHQAVSRRMMRFVVGDLGLQIESCDFSKL